MAEIWGAAIAAGAALYGASQQKSAASKAARASQNAADAATEEQKRQFDLTRSDQQPWLQAGQSALTQMQALNSGDFSSFTKSPDYQFAFDQGLQGLDRSAAARGSLYSGGHSADIMKFGQGLASQNYNQFYNRLAGLSGTGQTTASGLGTLGQQYANNVGQIGINNANNMASSFQQSANANSQLAGAIGGGFNKWYQGNLANNPGGTGWYVGSKPGPG
jgi:hypothetical protein